MASGSAASNTPRALSALRPHHLDPAPSTPCQARRMCARSAGCARLKGFQNCQRLAEVPEQALAPCQDQNRQRVSGDRLEGFPAFVRAPSCGLAASRRAACCSATCKLPTGSRAVGSLRHEHIPIDWVLVSKGVLLRPFRDHPSSSVDFPQHVSKVLFQVLNSSHSVTPM